MGKILLLAIAVWLLLNILKRYGQSMGNDSSSPSNPEDMVQCSHCKIHLPKSDSLLIDQHYYCCEAHSKQAYEHDA